jgi:hypothetical protein
MAFDPNNPAASGMVLTFDDEFNSLSMSNDGAANGTTWTNHLWYQQPDSNIASVSNGVLNLSSDGANNMVATVNSAAQGFSQKYGYFEARIKVPAGQGTWPAFFLISTDHALNGPAPASELDIMEGQGSQPNAYWTTLHRDSAHAGDQQNGNNFVDTGVNLSAGFHTFSALWSPNSNVITWYLDGKEVATAPKYDTTDSSPMEVILGSQIGDMTGTNQPNGSTPNPAVMQVDWVRVYQFADQNPHAVQPQPGYDGGTVSPSPSPAPTPAPTPTPTPTPSGSNGDPTITLHVSGDHWVGHTGGGDPQFVVLVDGQQVGGVQTVTAVHDNGQWQDITVNGNFSSNPQQVEVKFINDAFGGSHAQDINLYVDSITVGGHTYNGAQATNNASGGYTDSADPNAAMMVSNGTLTFNTAASPTPTPTPAPAPTPSGTGGDPSITLHVSGDHWAGSPSGADPQFVVLVDGQQVGGVQTVTAVHDNGQWQDITVNGNFSSNPQQVEVKFINDAFGGSHAQDVNLYVGSITVGGHQFSGTSAVNHASGGYASTDPNAAAMYTNGTLDFNLQTTSPTPTPTPTPMAASFSDGAGHDIFLFNALNQAGATIADFQSGQDVLDVAPLLKSLGYTGQDPLADHVINLAQTGDGSTAVSVDPTGHDPAHGTTLVTLEHVLPQNVHASDIWH